MSGAEQLRELAADLQRAANRALDAVEPVVKRGAVNIKKAWRDDARTQNATHAPHYYRSIDFDLGRDGLTVAAVIGPDKDKMQGPLGNLLEFGGPNNAPQMSGQMALDKEAPALEREIAKAERRLTW